MPACPARRRTIRRSILAATLASGFALVGCTNTRISGKVVSGPVLRAVTVASGDARLDRAGIGGVDLELLKPGGGRTPAYTRVATTTTAADGSFDFRVPIRDLQVSRVRLHAKGDAIYGGTADVFLPGEGESVIFQAPERSPDR